MAFPTEKHLASWVASCQGNNESTGKHKSGKARKVVYASVESVPFEDSGGNVSVRTVIIDITEKKRLLFPQISKKYQVVHGEGTGKTIPGQYLHGAEIGKLEVRVIEDLQECIAFPNG